MTTPQWQGPPGEHPDAPASSERGRVLRSLLVVLVLVVVAYLVAVTVTLLVGDQQKDSEIDRVGGTRITLSPQTLAGSPAPAAELKQAERTISARVKGLGIKNAQVALDGDSVVVTVPGEDDGRLHAIGRPERLLIRPVIQAIPAETPQKESEPPSGTLAERIATEKKPRQSDNQLIQLHALTVQATRCGQADVLAGHDDPTLPLVTCATDGQTAYLLAPSIIDGDQIKNATADMDPQQGGNVVQLVFTSAAADTWADFTAKNVGTATAFTLDSQVLGAPQIQQAIPGGRTQITGNFTADQARELATALNHRALPVAFDTSRTEHLAPKPASSNFGSPEFALIGGGFALMIALIGGLVFVMSRERT